MADDLQSKAADLVKKILTVGVGAVFLTEESVRSLVSEFKLPKELLQGVLEGANRTKNEFLKSLEQDIMSRIKDKLDPQAIVEEILKKNEIEMTIKLNFKSKSNPSERSG